MLGKYLRGWFGSRTRLSGRYGLVGPKPIRIRRLSIEILEARTLPSFAAPVAFDLGAAPKAVAVGHFEGTSAPLDVVTANANGTVSVLLGTGDGTLQNPISLTVGGTPDAVAVGDFLGNGLDDIVAANANGTVSVLLSNGNATFQAPETFAVGATPAAVALGDFTTHGQLDIVTANANGTLSVLPGNGDGTFQGPIISTVGGHLLSVAVGDFNQDGTPDLAAGTTEGLTVLAGNGDGTFHVTATFPFFVDPQNPAFGTIPVTSVEVGSFRGNATLDIVANSSLLSGNGDGTFQDPVQLNVGGQAASVAVGDFNGDGNLDIVTSNSAGPFGSLPASISFLAGNGDGTFQAARITLVGGTASALTVGDFTGTGTLGLAFASGFTDIVAALPGNGDGTFLTAPGFASPNFATAMASGVLTSSGKPDLVTTGDSTVVLLNNGNGTFRGGPVLPLSHRGTSVVIGAFNGDGNQDIAVGTVNDHLDGTVNVYLGHGDGTFAAPLVFDIGFDAFNLQLATGDFSGDGQLDLAVMYDQFVGSAEHSFLEVLLGQGDGTFEAGQTLQLPDDTFSLATGHFHDPNILDLVTTSAEGSVSILLGRGGGTFQPPQTRTIAEDVRGVAVADLHGDGRDDVVVNTLGHVGAPSDVIVLPGNGDGTFGSPQLFQVNSLSPGIGPVVGDFFGDGKLSVAVVTAAGVSVLRGNGDGTFQAPVNYLVDVSGFQPSTLVSADFNGDGKPDLAALSSEGRQVSVLLNTSPAPNMDQPVATATTLATDINPSVTGQPVTLTATVTSADGTPPTGSVTFLDGTTVLGVVALDPNGQASLVVPLRAGAHLFTASFAGIAPFTASTSDAASETVNRAATTTTLSAEVDGSFVQITATVLPVAPGAGLPTGTITLFDGGTIVGTAHLDAHGQAFFDFDDLPPGTHTFTASYSGDDGFEASMSDPLIVTI
jgi:hypothetical protein